MATTVRPRTLDDLDELAEVAERVRAETQYPRAWTGTLRDYLVTPAPLAAWVAELDGVIVGNVAIKESPIEQVGAVLDAAGVSGPFAVVTRLIVDPPFQRRGVARALLAAASDTARIEGRQLVLDVDAETGGAVDLYRSSGWREVGSTSIELADGSSADLLVMVGD